MINLDLNQWCILQQRRPWHCHIAVSLPVDSDRIHVCHELMHSCPDTLPGRSASFCHSLYFGYCMFVI